MTNLNSSTCNCMYMSSTSSLFPMCRYISTIRGFLKQLKLWLRSSDRLDGTSHACLLNLRQCSLVAVSTTHAGWHIVATYYSNFKRQRCTLMITFDVCYEHQVIVGHKNFHIMPHNMQKRFSACINSSYIYRLLPRCDTKLLTSSVLCA